MTENALSILIIIFSVQLQQTETSDRKVFIFYHKWNSSLKYSESLMHCSPATLALFCFRLNLCSKQVPFSCLCTSEIYLPLACLLIA